MNKIVIASVIVGLAGFVGLMYILNTPAADQKKQPPRSSGLPISTEDQGPKEKGPVVVMETSKGTIKIELNAEKAPISVKNFLQYVDEKHFDGTTFHRVIADFMIQGGGYEPGMKEKKTHAPIKNESGNGLKNERGTIAMARTDVLDSATSQFYINVVNNTAQGVASRTGKNDLDRGQYAVFGKVIEGMDIVDAIRAVPTGQMDVPKENIMIKSVRLQK